MLQAARMYTKKETGRTSVIVASPGSAAGIISKQLVLQMNCRGSNVRWHIHLLEMKSWNSEGQLVHTFCAEWEQTMLLNTRKYLQAVVLSWAYPSQYHFKEKTTLIAFTDCGSSTIYQLSIPIPTMIPFDWTLYRWDGYWDLGAIENRSAEKITWADRSIKDFTCHCSSLQK